jgi:DNA-directed RNA polymerase subunit RPC12/RpoP
MTSVPHRCEECGSEVRSGSEAPAGSTVESDEHESSDFCLNPDCPSNYAFRGFHRTGVAEYLCLECGATVHPPPADLAKHRRSHGERSTV